MKRELAELKSVRGRLRENELILENESLRSKLRQYDEAIERHGLWRFFGKKEPPERKNEAHVKS